MIRWGSESELIRLRKGRTRLFRETPRPPRCAVAATTGGRAATAAGIGLLPPLPGGAARQSDGSVGLRRAAAEVPGGRAHVESILRPARVGPAFWWSVGGEWRGLRQVTRSESACRFPALLLLSPRPPRASSQTP